MAGEARHLGRESVAFQALSLGRGARVVFRCRLRLFRHCFLCPGGGRYSPNADELKRFGSVRQSGPRKMDHHLCTQRSRLCCDRRAATRYHGLEQSQRSRSAALAAHFPFPSRLRAAPSRRALETEQPALTGRLPCCIVVSLPNEIGKAGSGTGTAKRLCPYLNFPSPDTC